MKSRDTLLRLFGQTHDAVFAVDSSQRIIYWNEGAKRLFGYSEAEVLNQPCWRAIGGRRGQRPFCGPDCRIQRCIKRGSYPPHCYFESRTREGRLIWVSASIIRLEQGSKPVSVHLLTNVSRQQRMRAALVSIQSALKSHGMIPSTDE
ncbi:MAG TPA: PAS domain-containing protein, partial [Terriglobales bacterium]|nr:PAS domain-containing protein [Terriglobales bacterium]